MNFFKNTIYLAFASSDLGGNIDVSRIKREQWNKKVCETLIYTLLAIVKRICR